jgi:uridine phosphorylase
MTYFPPTELVLNDKNEVYHLGLAPENLAEKIILVGDQGRVSMVSTFFDTLEHQSQHREFNCHTGSYQGKRISVISTGIGTDNIDIVLNEIDALVNIDLQERTEKIDKKSLEIVRIGTCGILQEEIPVHSYILSEYALGFDNIAQFYTHSFSAEETTIQKRLHAHLDFPSTISTYCSKAHPELVDRLKGEHVFSGITVTSSGFYGPQGRKLRIPLATTDMNEKLGTFSLEQLKVCNFEMESSALFFLSDALGHKATTICLGIANRPKNEFSKGYTDEMNGLIRFVLDRI